MYGLRPVQRWKLRHIPGVLWHMPAGGMALAPHDSPKYKLQLHLLIISCDFARSNTLLAHRQHAAHKEARRGGLCESSPEPAVWACVGVHDRPRHAAGLHSALCLPTRASTSVDLLRSATCFHAEVQGILVSKQLPGADGPGAAMRPNTLLTLSGSYGIPVAPARRQDHPDQARKVLLLSNMRPTFPSLLWGRGKDFEAGNIIGASGEKHKSLRAGWQPMFFSSRRGVRGLRVPLGFMFWDERRGAQVAARRLAAHVFLKHARHAWTQGVFRG